MDDKTREYWQARYPESSRERIELIGSVIFSHEAQKRMSDPSEWIKSPESLLENLRIIEEWRSEIISDNPRSLEEYVCTIHREKNLLFTLLSGAVQKMIIELRAVKATVPLPVCADRLEKFARTLEVVQQGSDDPQAVYDLARIIGDEIRTMEAFCELHQKQPNAPEKKYTMQQLRNLIQVESTATVGKYLTAAGLPVCGRGKARVFRLTHEQTLAFLNHVTSQPSVDSHRLAAEKALRGLNFDL